MKREMKTTVAAKKLAAVVVLYGLLLGAGLAALSCERKESGRSGGASSPTLRRADRVYTTRGQIRMLPARDKPTAELIIHHEPIDDFESPDGTRGMSSMEMPFPAGAGASLEGLKVDDIVEFDLSVWYAQGKTTIEAYRVTRVKKLAGDTKLNFGAAAPTLGGAGEK